MLFNSYIFILAFLPVTWIIYFGLNKYNLFKTASMFLVFASLVFYGYNNWKFCFVLIASILVNYALHLMLHRFRKGKKSILVLGLIYNFGLLFYIKYFDFFLDNINSLLGLDFAMKNIILPLGISFYTFQQVSFLVDSYKGNAEKYSFIEYALFVSFFPQLIAGPIVLHTEMIPQFRDTAKRKVNFNNLYEGLQYFFLGLGKKVLIADTFGKAVDWGYDNLWQLNSLSAAVLILSFTIQIYFDFSGYCEMAIGLGKLFNFDIAMNFNSPYKADSVGEFWDRWHMTLTRFFTRYLYIPLGGNRKGKRRAYINTMIVFLISGLWHGADWTFVFWGMLHGGVLVFEKICGGKLEKIPRWIRRAAVFGFINFAWVFFRADHFRQALSVFKRLLLGGAGNVAMKMQEAFAGNILELLLTQICQNTAIFEFWMQIAVWIWIVFTLVVIMKTKNIHAIVAEKRSGRTYVYAVAGLAILSILSLSDVSKFLYFNF